MKLLLFDCIEDCHKNGRDASEITSATIFSKLHKCLQENIPVPFYFIKKRNFLEKVFNEERPYERVAFAVSVIDYFFKHKLTKNTSHSSDDYIEECHENGKDTTETTPVTKFVMQPKCLQEDIPVPSPFMKKQDFLDEGYYEEEPYEYDALKRFTFHDSIKLDADDDGKIGGANDDGGNNGGGDDDGGNNGGDYNGGDGDDDCDDDGDDDGGDDGGDGDDDGDGGDDAGDDGGDNDDGDAPNHGNENGMSTDQFVIVVTMTIIFMMVMVMAKKRS